jgi:hypothetical protein
MARLTTELGQLHPPPPYTRWDQRVKPVLLCYLKNLTRGKSLCLSLQTQNPDIAMGHMQLIVEWSLAKGHLSPDSGAARVYGPKGTGRSRFNKIASQVRRLKGVPKAKYGSEALALAKSWARPVGIIHFLTGRKPELAAGTYATRRMRARGDGKSFPKADTWEHRPQGGKCYGWNGNVLTARVQIDSRKSQWPLKATNEQEAEAVMAPVRVARKRLYRAAAKELNCELGTNEAVAAATERTGARAELASAIIAAGGPKELAEFVLRGPQAEVRTVVSQPVVNRRADRRAIKQANLEKCVERYIELIKANPDRAPEPRDVLAQKMTSDFGVTLREARECRAKAIKSMENLNWPRRGRPRG